MLRIWKVSGDELATVAIEAASDVRTWTADSGLGFRVQGLKLLLWDIQGEMVVSVNRGAPYRSRNMRILIMAIPTKVPPQYWETP